MNNWNTKTLPRFSEHQRSASVAGYQETSLSDYEPPKSNQNWPNRTHGNYYNSSFDISKLNPGSNDFQKFLWNSRSPYEPSASVSTYSESAEHSQRQRPFETAFKSAIIKLKESSLSRLGAVEKNNISTQNAITNHVNNDSDEMFQRRCQTLQPPKKYSTDTTRTESKRKVFRCEPTFSKVESQVYSISKVSKDFISDSKPENRTEQYKSTREYLEDSNINKPTMSNFQYSNQQKAVKSGSSIIIPIKDNKIPGEIKRQESVTSEAFISPNFNKLNESSVPHNSQLNQNICEDEVNFESLPSVQEVISKVEALSTQSDKSIMSKSLNITHEKPPILLNYRTNSQKNLDNYTNQTVSNEVQTLISKRMSGLYKKNPPSTIKGKSIANMPSDFQKLHLAFLDQKQEIQRLRQEVTEKNEQIKQLETFLKTYEPWR